MDFPTLNEKIQDRTNSILINITVLKKILIYEIKSLFYNVFLGFMEYIGVDLFYEFHMP